MKGKLIGEENDRCKNDTSCLMGMDPYNVVGKGCDDGLKKKKWNHNGMGEFHMVGWVVRYTYS